MKKFILSLLALVAIVVLSMTFGSCTKDESFQTLDSILRTDNPPADMFESDYNYGEYYYVFIENDDIQNIKLYGNVQVGTESHFDMNTGAFVTNNFYQEFYKISAKKYFGLYKKGQTVVSVSTDFYLIPAYELEQVRILIKRKDATVLKINDNQIDSRWKTINGPK